MRCGDGKPYRKVRKEKSREAKNEQSKQTRSVVVKKVAPPSFTAAE